MALYTGRLLDLWIWPGILWYLYEDTKDNMWREADRKSTDMIAPLAYRKAKSHDSGFIMMCSLGNGYRLTGNRNIRKDCCMPQILWLCFIILLWVLFILAWNGEKETGRINTIMII